MSVPSSQVENSPLTVLIDDQVHLEYDRNKPLPEKQLAYLGRMERQMDAGIQLGSGWVEHPEPFHRAQFVAIHLIEALQQGNDALVAASCAYLASRLPEMKQLKARSTEGGFAIELVFDEPYVAETVVNFVPRTTS